LPLNHEHPKRRKSDFENNRNIPNIFERR